MEMLRAATILKPRYHNIKVLFHKSLPQEDLDWGLTAEVSPVVLPLLRWSFIASFDLQSSN